MAQSATKIISQASVFAREFAAVKHPDLLGITDGKAVGTYIETAFDGVPVRSPGAMCVLGCLLL